MIHQSTVKYVKTDNNGKEKKVSEIYLVDAISQTDVEVILNTELGYLTNSEINIKSTIKKEKYEVLTNYKGGCWFCAKVDVVITDDNSNKEKTTASYLFFEADNFAIAYENTNEILDSWACSYELKSISETRIVDFFEAEKLNPDDSTLVTPCEINNDLE